MIWFHAFLWDKRTLALKEECKYRDTQSAIWSIKNYDSRKLPALLGVDEWKLAGRDARQRGDEAKEKKDADRERPLSLSLSLFSRVLFAAE